MRRAHRGVGLALVAALAAPACGGEDAPAPASGAPPSEVCDDQEQPRLQSGSHLLGDTDPPVPYSSVPPTSGWHRSGQPRLGVVDEPLDDPELVSALEVGHVVVAYDPARVSRIEVDRLEELAEGALADRLTVTPYLTEMPSAFAYLGWGALRRCDQLDEGALTAFVLSWFGASTRDH